MEPTREDYIKYVLEKRDLNLATKKQLMKWSVSQPVVVSGDLLKAFNKIISYIDYELFSAELYLKQNGYGGERMTGYIEFHNGRPYWIPEDHVYYKGEVMDIDEMLARQEREAYTTEE